MIGREIFAAFYNGLFARQNNGYNKLPNQNISGVLITLMDRVLIWYLGLILSKRKFYELACEFEISNLYI